MKIRKTTLYQSVERKTKCWTLLILLLFISTSVFFWLLGFIRIGGSFEDRSTWLISTLDPRLHVPPVLVLIILVLIGYPFTLPARKSIKQYVWFLAPLVGFAYWSLWIFPSYIGLPFKLCVALAAFGVIIAYFIALFAGALKTLPSMKGLLSVATVVIVVSILHMYPYSQLGGLTTYSGTGNNDMFHYACRAASITEEPLSRRPPYIEDNERGKLYRSSINSSKRMGFIVASDFLQASIAILPGLSIITSFPVTIVVAILLTLLGTYLVSRLAFSMSHAVSLLASGLIGLSPIIFFVEQSGYLHHLCGVVCLGPIFFMAVQGASRKWICFAYAFLFLLVLYAHYFIILPLGAMLLIGAPAAVSFYILMSIFIKFFSKLWLQKHFAVRIILVIGMALIVCLLSYTLFYGMKYAVSEIMKRIPGGFYYVVNFSMQEVFGIQPRAWMNRNAHSINEHSILAKSLLSLMLLSFFAGIIRLLMNKKKEVRASVLALLFIVGLLGYSFYQCKNPYASLKYWSYVWPLLCIFPIAGIMLVVEKWPGIMSTFISLLSLIIILNVNAANLFMSGNINVAHAKFYGSYVDSDMRNLKKLFSNISTNDTIFLGPMNRWEMIWASFYAREWNVTTDKQSALYFFPIDKMKRRMKLLDDWSYRITTTERLDEKFIARKGRFFLYAR